MKISDFDLKWVHMARYELILRLDGALWLRIISKPLLTLCCRFDLNLRTSATGSVQWAALGLSLIHI